MGEPPFDQDRWPPMPPLHRDFLRDALATLARETRVLGVAAGGSLARGAMDAHSDLDLLVVADPRSAEELRADGLRLAASLGPLLTSFTGEHVGAPELRICLYGPPLLHVDLEFGTLEALGRRTTPHVVLWERGDALQRARAEGGPTAPAGPDLQWIEDRFWAWVHYLVGKIERGELFDAMDGLAFLRGRVLGPLVLQEAGAAPHGLRRVELHAPARLDALRATLAAHERDSCRAALAASVRLYGELRERLAPEALTRRGEAEAAARVLLAPDPGRPSTDADEGSDACRPK
jgi:predicted nucleotidyltransferase